ncbi:MAG TPA: glycosyltransferase family 4 protein [Vicinamibacterales bacterium]|nr:glycosyltransferase family 4 protein [Vicinamibacterales bacterium]
MRILMIAPEPFFEPRGTPFSEYHRIRALLELGHTVDLVTYPFGQDVSLPGLRIFRCSRPPFVRSVRVGPSAAKLVLDVALAVTALRVALKGPYDAIHSHEEGAAIGVLLANVLGVPHLYDMHSSLPQQLGNFGFSGSRALRWLFERFERIAVRRSQVVIVICPELRERVREVEPDADPVLIENAPGAVDAPCGLTGEAIRRRFGVPADAPLVVYTGTFEAYQGLDLLFTAIPQVVRARPDVRFLLAGGRPDQVERARDIVRHSGVDGTVIFAGERPAEEIPAFLEAADVLVSPRSRGTNTPLKIYQYLRAGRAIVATALRTHTQVLNEDVAILTDATATEFARGILKAIRDPEASAAMGARAAQLAASKYSYDAYLARTRDAMARLSATRPAEVAGGVA